MIRVVVIPPYNDARWALEGTRTRGRDSPNVLSEHPASIYVHDMQGCGGWGREQMLLERCDGAGCAVFHGPHGHAGSTAAQRVATTRSCARTDVRIVSVEQTETSDGRHVRGLTGHVMRPDRIAAPLAHTTQREKLSTRSASARRSDGGSIVR